MLQFASSHSSSESEIAKAESVSRRNHLQDETRWRVVDDLACYITGLESHRACMGYVGKTDYRPQSASRHPPRALTNLTTGMGITAATSDQRHCFQHDNHCQACISARGYHTRYFSVWFPLHIVPTNLGCRAETAVI
ncbi:hypothetical protein AVEN_1555-1 [Araneus ventricosus]|uniref:Uncharacterized protein n=1 Tax=Araneus ventricosus TaxID=182803 RepID=A0A4Y2DQ27_ARAVE|nr:hypothetical protein AVEN_1555-1 [Araneus ventricosus]